MPDPYDLLPLSATDLQLLLVLEQGPLHAYGISKAVEAVPETGVRLEIGSLYRILTRLTSAGLIEHAESPRADVPRTGREASRRYYALTTFGEQVARLEVDRLRRVLGLDAARRLAAGSTER